MNEEQKKQLQAKWLEANGYSAAPVEEAEYEIWAKKVKMLQWQREQERFEREREKQKYRYEQMREMKLKQAEYEYSGTGLVSEVESLRRIVAMLRVELAKTQEEVRLLKTKLGDLVITVPAFSLVPVGRKFRDLSDTVS